MTEATGDPRRDILWVTRTTRMLLEFLKNWKRFSWSPNRGNLLRRWVLSKTLSLARLTNQLKSNVVKKIAYSEFADRSSLRMDRWWATEREKNSFNTNSILNLAVIFIKGSKVYYSLLTFKPATFFATRTFCPTYFVRYAMKQSRLSQSGNKHKLNANSWKFSSWPWASSGCMRWGGGGGALLGAVHCRHQFVELIFEWLMLLLSRRLPRAMRLI